jgi:hypothetical protein
MPLPKVPAQGDTARLQQLASGLKKENGTYGSLVQRNDVGRPSAPSGGLPTQSAPDVTPEHQQAYDEAAQIEWAREYWTMMAERYPGPRTAYYLARAEKLAEETMPRTYESTPNFEY